MPNPEDTNMAIEGATDFPRFTALSSGVRDAESRLLSAIKRRDKKEIIHSRLELQAALDEYRNAVDGLGEETRS